LAAKNKAKQTQSQLAPSTAVGLKNQVEKTKPILWKGKSNKAKGKMRVNSVVFPIYI